MKKLIFLLTVLLCSLFLISGCGTSETKSNETDAIIGEWCNLNGISLAKISIKKENNEYIYTGKAYQARLQKESSSPQSPLIIKITDSDHPLIDKTNAKLTKTDDKSTLYIDGRKSQPLKYNSQTNTISIPVGSTGSLEFKPTKNITEQEKREWADQAIKELSNTYKAKRDGEYGIIDKIDLSIIK